MEYSPLNKASLAETIAQKLQERIISGKYLVGEKLPTEPELMDLFGVGRSSIREAIRILVNTGYIIVKQGSGTYVKTNTAPNDLSKRLQLAALQDLVEVRQWLEVKIAEKAAKERSPKDILQMQEALQRRWEFAQAGEVQACISADIQFHSAIAVAAKNAITLELYRTIAQHIQQNFTDLYHDTSTFLETQQLHQALLDAIIAQDQERAWHCAREITGHMQEYKFRNNLEH